MIGYIIIHIGRLVENAEPGVVLVISGIKANCKTLIDSEVVAGEEFFANEAGLLL